MKKLFYLCLLLFLSAPVFAQKAVSVIARQYVEREKSYLDRPYSKDDMSYGLYFDVFDGIGGWRVGASYASDLTGVGDAKSVITPELTLLGKEGIWDSGFSVMIDYVDTEEGTEWGDIYYQFQLGLIIPLGGRLELGASMFFPFTDLGDFRDIGFNELDLGLLVRAKF